MWVNKNNIYEFKKLNVKKWSEFLKEKNECNKASGGTSVIRKLIFKINIGWKSRSDKIKDEFW